MFKHLTSLLLIVLSCVISSMAITTTATSSGSWGSNGIWDNGVPSCPSTDVIIIPSGIRVDIKNSSINLSSCDLMIIIEDGGVLELERTGNGGNEALLILSASSSIKFEGTGKIEAVSNQASKYNTIVVEVGGTEVWNGSQTSNQLAGPGFVNSSTSGGIVTSTLPVDLLSFKAYAEKNEVVLVWITASEINNDKFYIQKSKDGKNYEIVDALEGQGTKNTPTEYIYKDKAPYEGLSFYRLKQTDFNGDFSITDIVQVDFKNQEKFEVEVYPNPLNSGHNLYLKIPSNEGEEFEIFVNDLLGKDYITDLTFINQSTHTMVILELNSNLPTGTYFINVVGKSGVTSKKVLVR